MMMSKSRTALMALLWLGVGVCAQAQTTSPGAETPTTSAQATTDLLGKVDQLVEQNKRLQQQNQDLMDQIELLRSNLTGQTVQPGSNDATSGQAHILAETEPPSAKEDIKGPEPGAQPDKPSGEEYGRNMTWNLYEPGKGFDVVKSDYASLNISGYLVARYLNQLPANQSFVDHNGMSRVVDTRQDFQLHRVMLYFTGYLLNPKVNYNITLWTVNDTAQTAIVGALYYAASKHFTFGVGWNGIPGTRSMQGSHPYWPSYDRVMADEFFRPYFTQAFFAEGALLRRLSYKFALGNNLSNLDVTAVKLTRDLSQGIALTWLPTTGEFGPRGAFGDYEHHETLATRMGVAYSHSREDRFNSVATANPDNTTIRLGDSLLLFETGSLAPGVTVQKATYQLISSDIGVKFKGLWLQGEGYYRLINDFVATGSLPITNMVDSGFYVQGAYMVVPKKVELYGSTSWIFPQFHPLGETHPHEYIGGVNWYPLDSRNYRLNLQAADVFRSPVSSTFGFYVGGLKGVSFAVGATALF